MGMLDRIKKKQIKGFKEFVISMETSGRQTRSNIFTVGVLEDPIFMNHVMNNLKSFDDFLRLNSDDISKVLDGQEQILNLFAKCFYGEEKLIMNLESVIPGQMARLKEEFSYLKDVTQKEKDAARFYILKITRKLQMEGVINGFSWSLPPQDIYYPKQIKDGAHKIYFDNGCLAAEGLYLKQRRMGDWRHYYDSGKLLAHGDYFDGQKTGLWKFYFGNGSLKSEGKYKDDQKHGTWKEYDRLGNMTESQYSDGIRKAG
jgi:MORN repeat variant